MGIISNYVSPETVIHCCVGFRIIPDSKVHGAKMGPTWGRQDPSGPHVGPMNFVIWYVLMVFRQPVHDNPDIGLYLLDITHPASNA